MPSKKLILLGCAGTLLWIGCGMPLSDEPDNPYESPATLSVETTTPEAGASGVSLTDNLTVTFNQGVGGDGMPTSSSNACTAGIQLSFDGFATCEIASLTTTRDFLTYTLDPEGSLASETTYQLRASGVQALGGATLTQEAGISFTTEALCDSGCDWEELTPSGLTARQGHAGVTFNNKMYVLGGFAANGNRMNTVESSTDGITWSTETTPGWTARNGLAAVVYRGKIWVIGGDDGSVRNDVWTFDGTTWTEVRANGTGSGFTARSGHAAIVFDDQLWVMGGSDGSNGYLNDIWSSTDGIDWTPQGTASWSVRADHTAAFLDGKIWIMGGSNGSALSDVWSSSNGTTWTRVSSSAFPADQDHQSAIFEQALWAVQGDNGSGRVHFWTSTSGASWSQGTTNYTWNTSISNGVLLRYDNALYLIGGTDGSNALNTVLRYGK